MYPHSQIWRPLALVSALVAATVFATATITVAPGDTLSEIAERHGVTVDQLLTWNDLDDADRIFAGTVLIVSAPDADAGPAAASSGTHVVTAGDTLSAIAVRFGTSVARIIAANDLSNPDRIYVGQSLRMTAAAPSTTTSAPTRTHTVAAGDTLGTIAAKYGVKTGVLAADNGIADPDLIRTGMVLSIGAPSPTPSARPAPTTTPAPATPAPTPNARPGGQVLLAPIFARWAEVYDVPQDLLEALAWKASNWQAATVGSSGHLGIMQLSPATVELIEGGLLGRAMDPLDADNGVQMGARFLRYLLDRTGSEREAIAAWGQGLASVQNSGVNANGAAFADAIEEIRVERR